jgi:gas vesicle protein
VGQESDELRREIEETRRELGTDVDALTEKVSPKRVVERRVDRARDAVSGLKERVMGTTSNVTSSTGGGLSSAASTVGDTASSAVDSVQGATSSAASTVADTATSTAQAARRRAQGNPLAAGVIAFGLGWLVSSILPATQKERQAAGKVKEQAQPALQPVARQAGQALQEVKENLREPAQQAAQSVKETASDAAARVQDEARSSAQDVRDQTRQSAEQVRQQSPAGS